MWKYVSRLNETICSEGLSKKSDAKVRLYLSRSSATYGKGIVILKPIIVMRLKCLKTLLINKATDESSKEKTISSNEKCSVSCAACCLVVFDIPCGKLKLIYQEVL